MALPSFPSQRSPVSTLSLTPALPASSASRCCAIPELLDRIVDFLARNTSRARIADLSLVFKTWHPTIVSRLWRIIGIDQPNGVGEPIAVSAFGRLSASTKSLVRPARITIGAFTIVDADELQDFIAAVAASVTQWVMLPRCDGGLLRYVAEHANGDAAKRLGLTVRAADDVEVMETLLARCEVLEDLAVYEGADVTLRASLKTLKHPELVRRFIFQSASPWKPVGEDVYRAIGRMKNLEYLRIEEGRISGEKLSLLQSLRHLRKSVLCSSHPNHDTVTERNLESFLSLVGRNLETLHLTHFPGELCCAIIPMYCPSLRELILDHCDILTFDVVSPLVSSLPHLSLLSLRGKRLQCSDNLQTVKDLFDPLAHFLASRVPRPQILLEWESYMDASEVNEAMAQFVMVKRAEWDHWNLECS